ncbi:MAG: DsbA family protein [Fidelibacterota bacterium]
MLALIEFTDPYCTWCWGFEPIVRKIQMYYGKQVQISYIMGGLVADMDQFYDPTNRIGGANWRQQVADHWKEASHRHGMPVDERIFLELDNDFRSTYPACMSYKAAQLQDEGTAHKFLRRLREGAAAERKPIHQLIVQQELAEEVGLDSQRFLADIKNGNAWKAFLQDLSECRTRGITGFPTFLIRNDEGQESILHGYHKFDDFVAIFESLESSALSVHPIKPSQQAIHDFIRKYDNVTEKEIAAVFDLPTEATREILRQLQEQSSLKKRKVGNGFFYSVA